MLTECQCQSNNKEARSLSTVAKSLERLFICERKLCFCCKRTSRRDEFVYLSAGDSRRKRRGTSYCSLSRTQRGEWILMSDDSLRVRKTSLASTFGILGFSQLGIVKKTFLSLIAINDLRFSGLNTFYESQKTLSMLFQGCRAARKLEFTRHNRTLRRRWRRIWRQRSVIALDERNKNFNLSTGWDSNSNTVRSRKRRLRLTSAWKWSRTAPTCTKMRKSLPLRCNKMLPRAFPHRSGKSRLEPATTSMTSDNDRALPRNTGLGKSLNEICSRDAWPRSFE